MVALYIRVSTEEQAKYGISVDTQKQALIDYCESNDLKYDIYCDEGISAKNMNRPGLQSLINNIKKYDIVLFTKLDRLSRNVLDANTINVIFEKNNVNMKAIFEDDIDTSTADGKFMFNLKCSLAEREIKKTSERIKDVFNYKVAVQKEVISGTKIYGYDIIDKHYVINEKESINIKKLFDMYIMTSSINQCCIWWRDNIKKELNNTIRGRLFNKKYNGVYEYNGKNYYDYIPKIIDDDVFQKVQKLLKMNYKTYPNKSGTNRIYLFSGLLYCGSCGVKMTGSTYKTGLKSYRCARKEYKACNNNHYYNEKLIEKEVLKQLPLLIKNISVTLADKKEPILDNTPKIKNKLNKLQDLYINGLISLDDYKLKYNELNQQLDEEIKKTKPKPKINKELISLKNVNIIDIYNKLNDESKQQFFRSCIERIDIISKDEIKVQLKLDYL